MTTDSIGYRTAPPPKLRPSPLGVTAFVISLFVPLMLILVRVFNFLIDGHSETYWLGHSEAYWLKVRLMPVWPGFVNATYVLFPVGLIAGALGAMRRGYQRRLAVLACVINASVLAALLAWIIGLLP
jgi:hypothetical protein